MVSLFRCAHEASRFFNVIPSSCNVVCTCNHCTYSQILINFLFFISLSVKLYQIIWWILSLLPFSAILFQQTTKKRMNNKIMDQDFTVFINIYYIFLCIRCCLPIFILRLPYFYHCTFLNIIKVLFRMLFITVNKIYAGSRR